MCNLTTVYERCWILLAIHFIYEADAAAAGVARCRNDSSSLSTCSSIAFCWLPTKITRISQFIDSTLGRYLTNKVYNNIGLAYAPLLLNWQQKINKNLIRIIQNVAQCNFVKQFFL